MQIKWFIYHRSIPALWWKAICSNFNRCYGLSFLGQNQVLIVVTARWQRASLMSKNKLAIPEGSWLVDKTDSLGYIPVWGSCVGCIAFFVVVVVVVVVLFSCVLVVFSFLFFSFPPCQHYVYTYAEPIPQHIKNCIPRTKLWHFLS